MKVLILGASGMLGSTVLRVLAERDDLDVFGTIRDKHTTRFFSKAIAGRLKTGIDLEQQDSVVRMLDEIRPKIVVNCAGLIKHRDDADDPLIAIPINSLLPQRLAALCKLTGARLIQISTDCVFSGEKGAYKESDPVDAHDVYGRTKALGEVLSPHAITLRTSIIGHELASKRSLLEWFLSQDGQCNGYTRAIFSGLPTVVLSQIIRDVVIPHEKLSGLYHVAAKPISKFDLLKMIASVYGKPINILPNDELSIDRSLDATKLRLATGYVAPEWMDMIKLMHAYK